MRGKVGRRGDESVVPKSKAGASMQTDTMALELGTQIKLWQGH